MSDSPSLSDAAAAAAAADPVLALAAAAAAPASLQSTKSTIFAVEEGFLKIF